MNYVLFSDRSTIIKDSFKYPEYCKGIQTACMSAAAIYMEADIGLCPGNGGRKS